MLDRINIKNHSAGNISRVQFADDDQNQNTLPEHKCNTDPEGSVKVWPKKMYGNVANCHLSFFSRDLITATA